MDEEHKESPMSQNSSRHSAECTTGALLNQIDRLRDQLSTQIGRTDQLIVDRNNTVLQIQQFYEKSLHNKEMELNEQKEINSNLNVSLKECRERLSIERTSLKQNLRKHFADILNLFIDSKVPFSVFVEDFDSNSFKQIRDSFSTLIFNYLIELALNLIDSDQSGVKEIQCQNQLHKLNEQLVQVFDRVSPGLQVTHRIAYKGSASQSQIGSSRIHCLTSCRV